MLALGLVAAGLVWIVGTINEATEGPDTSEWVTYTAPDKQFTAKFPKEPTVTNEDVGGGVRVTFTMVAFGPNHFEVSWVQAPRDLPFSFEEAMRESAKEVEGQLTRSSERQFCGMPGMYGEVDNGRVKIQFFRSRDRIWTVAASEYREDFDFFLKNLRLSEEAQGLKKFSAEFQAGSLYEGVDAGLGRVGPVPQGGRHPYRCEISGNPPPGLRVEYREGAPGREQICALVGAPPNTGKFPVQFTVFDADERSVIVKADLVVAKRPEVLGSMGFSARYPSRGGAADYQESLAGEYSVPVGETIKVVLAPKSNLEGYALQIDRAEVKGAKPEWLTVRPNEATVELSGRPEIVGAQSVELDFVLRLKGGSLTGAVTQKISFMVEGVANTDDLLPAVAPARIAAKVGIRGSWKLAYTASKPASWGRERDWHLSGEWDTSAVKLPAGLKAVAQLELDGVLPTLLIEGVPQEAGKWEFELKLPISIRYVSDPIEVIVPVSINVAAILDSEIPACLRSAPAEWLVESKAGKKVGSPLPLDFTRPRDWNDEREWKLEVDWNTADIKLPEGLYFEELKVGTDKVPRLFLKGATSEIGEWTFELKVKVSLKYVADAQEVLLPIRITVK